MARADVSRLAHVCDKRDPCRLLDRWWLAAVCRAGGVRRIENPATLELVDEARTTRPADDVRRACAAAAKAQRPWRRMPALERGRCCTKPPGLMRADRARLSELLTREGGKPRIENLDEVEWCAACFQYYAELARSSHGIVDPADRRTPDQLHDQGAARRRRGDRAVQLPAAAARLEDRAGARRRQRRRHQAVGADAARRRCGSSRRRLAHLPPGVVNVVTGTGAEVGAALVDDPDVACIAFTGSTARRHADRRARGASS